MDKGSSSKSCDTTSITKYELTFITPQCWAKYSIKALLTTAHCACIRPQFPHSTLNFAKTTARQKHALHLLLAKTTHSLPTEFPDVWVRHVREGEGLATKKYQVMGILYHITCTELALSHHAERNCHILSLDISRCIFRTFSHCGRILHDYATETFRNWYPLISVNW